MSRQKVIAGTSGAVAVLSLIGIALLSGQPQTYSGADSAPAQFSWVGILQVLFGGSTIASISSLWSILRPVVRSVVPESVPLPPENIESKVEFISAGYAYLKNREDKAAQLRFALSSLVEIGSIEAMKTESVQSLLRQLTVAIAAEQFPVKSE